MATSAESISSVMRSAGNTSTELTLLEGCLGIARDNPVQPQPSRKRHSMRTAERAALVPAE